MSEKKITVALGQFAPAWKAVDKNMTRMLSMIEEAGKAGADLIVFPELSRTGYSPKPSEEDIAVVGESLPSSDSRRILELGQRYQIAVVYGTLERSSDGVFNSAVWTEHDKLFRYHKTHIHWTENFTPGEDFPVFESRLAKAGIVICFDLAFPEAVRSLALKSADFIVAPSAVPQDFKNINRKRVVARAMDNQVFVIYCNYTGKDYQGGSLVADPSGEIQYEVGAKPGVYLHTIDLGLVDYWRNYERIYPHRRPDLYKF